MPASSSSSLLRLSAAALVVLASLGSSGAAGQVVTADQCARDPSASITVDGMAGPLMNGAIFQCPNSISVTFQAIATMDTADDLRYVGSASYSICSIDGGGCLKSGSLPASGGSSGASSISVQTGLPVSTGYIFQVTGTTGPRPSANNAFDPFTCRYDNNQCVAACRTCTEVVTVRCYDDPDELAERRAASGNGGAGSGPGVITGGALVTGQPFAASSFGASLPLAAGKTLNPRCELTALTFTQPYARSAAVSYAIPLPTDGSDEVVIRDCANITPAQVALLTAGTSTPFQPTTTYLSLTAARSPAGSSELCNDVLTVNTPNRQTQFDGAVTSYDFAGDLAVRTPVPNTINGLVCADTIANGPVASLPAASWRSASFAVTAAHTSRNSLCDDSSCVGGNADGACSSCAYTYRVRFACDEVAPPPTTPTTPPNGGGGIVGDPQFVGLRGQEYQVHGVSGVVYSIVSSPDVQYNARFVFLSSGSCPVIRGRAQRGGCYSHPGSYLGELGLKSAGGLELIRIAAGGAAQGFAAVALNDRELAVGETALLEDGAGSLSRNSTHLVSVTLGPWSFDFSNSDRFINQKVRTFGPAAALRSHGLLGQTWREDTYPKAQVKYVQGVVDDYAIRGGDLFGDDFAFNAYN